MPRMLRDIVTDAVTAEPDIDVVGEVPAFAALSEAAGRTGADCVVMAVDGDGIPEECARLVWDAPAMRLVLVSPDGLLASVYRLVPRRDFLAEVSPRSLLEAIRGEARFMTSS